MTEAPPRPNVATLASAGKLALAAPVLTGAGRLADSIALPAGALLHAGPAYRALEEIPRCVLNAAAAAAMAEGWAADLAEGRAAVAAGEIALAPAQNHGLVVPLAFVAGPSTAILTVACRETGAVGRAPLNDGPPKDAARFGAPTADTATRLRMLAEVAAPALNRALLAKPIVLNGIAAAALRQGDELHASVRAANTLLLERLAPMISDADVQAYLASAGQFFLNVWMAAALAMLNAGAGVAGSSLLAGAGANGVRTGVRLASAPAVWLEQSAAAPRGPRLSDDLAAVAVSPSVGDSAVIEAAGFGALAARHAPAVEAAFAPYQPARSSQDDLGVAPHPAFADLNLNVGVDRARLGPATPMPAHFAMLDAAGEIGLVGRGRLDFWSAPE